MQHTLREVSTLINVSIDHMIQLRLKITKTLAVVTEANGGGTGISYFLTSFVPFAWDSHFSHCSLIYNIIMTPHKNLLLTLIPWKETFARSYDNNQTMQPLRFHMSKVFQTLSIKKPKRLRTFRLYPYIHVWS